MARGYMPAHVQIIARRLLRGRRIRRSLTALATALVVTIGLLMGVPSPASANASSSAPPAANTPTTPVVPVASHYQKPKAVAQWKPAPVTWPSGSADVSLADTTSPAASAATPSTPSTPETTTRSTSTPPAVAPSITAPHVATAPVRAGTLPVWIAPAVPSAAPPSTAPSPGKTSNAAPSAPGDAHATSPAPEAAPSATPRAVMTPARVHVTVAPHGAATAVGVNGVLVSVQRADTNAFSGQAAVSIGYGSFADAFGGDWATRLRLMTLPACALTTPKIASCRIGTPVPFTRNAAAGQLTATLTMPAATKANTAAPTVVLAATSSGSGGGNGDYTASTLQPSGSWQAGGSTDSFTWSYPISVPAVPGGLQPQVQLSYDSQAVDGLISSTNNQASWIGDGWNYSPGSIQRSFGSCAQNPTGATQTGDACWSPNNTLTLSLNGSNTPLIYDDTTHTYHPEFDTDEQVTYHTGANNGAQNGEYFVVTTDDGTQYYFGLNQLPGYNTGGRTNDPTTNSVWTEPVYATSAGQPCYNATFANSWCSQAYQWNLDYVKDTHGDVASYFYGVETNAYAADNPASFGATQTNPNATLSYDRGGYLTSIQYGQRDQAVYSSQPAGKVVFTTTGRCDLSTCNTSTLSSSTASDWPDVPYDLNCAQGAACQSISPSFWTENTLSTIETYALVGSTETAVDSWSLAHSFPSTGEPPTNSAGQKTTPSLWLSSITHTGLDTTAGGSTAPITLPPVTFTPQALANRVDLKSGYPPITRQRLTTITTETGETIGVSYSQPACGQGTPLEESQNTSLCYPAYWTPAGLTAPIEDWFNKYRVMAVTEQDPTGGAADDTIVTTYNPVGNPTWHYDDNPLTPTGQRTWNDWRGYPGMSVTTGTGDDPKTNTTYAYFQGMNGDTLPGGGTRTVSVKDSLGESIPDLPQYESMTYETTVDNGSSVVTDTITDPWSSAATASHATGIAGLPTEQAFMTGTADTRVYTPLANGTTRETKTSNTYDSYGRVTQVNDQGDLSTTHDDLCTTTTYDDNTGAWILNAPSEVTTISAACGTATPSAANTVSDVQTYYDGALPATPPTTPPTEAAPTKGDRTTTLTLTSYTGTTPNWATTSQTVDEYGRALSATDADNRTSFTTFTPATGAAPTTTATKDPKGYITTTVDDPLRAVATKTTDPAGFVTSEQYDALGRLTAVTKPGIFKPSLTYTYTVSNSGPSVVDTNTLNEDGTYRVAETLYDAMLRARETQTQTASNGRDITDTIYNSDGWVSESTDPYYNPSPVSTTYVQAPVGDVPSETGFTYDGDGRKTAALAKAGENSSEVTTWQTSYVYGGDYTTTIPPAGGTASTTITDARGNTTDLIQYHTGVPADPSDPASEFSDTHYTYTPAKKLATVTDAAGNSWSYGYDLIGDQTSATDPDAGTSTSVYDPAGQLQSVTDARGKQVTTQYDTDGRKTGTYDTTGGAAPSSSNRLATWAYDTTLIGQGPAKAVGYPSSTTSYSGGDTYTQTIREYLPNAQVGDTIDYLTGQDAALVPAKGWNVGYGYTNTGAPSGEYDDAIDGLPAENITTGYDNTDQPSSLASSLDSAAFLPLLSYTQLGQPQQYTFLASPYNVYLSLGYDQQTQALNDVNTTVNVPGGDTANTVDDLSYRYSGTGVSAGAGLVTSVIDSQNAGATTDTQCFGYDYAQRLSQAWTGTDGCAATPTPGNSPTVGGPQPYWQSWTYDAAGDRKTETDHDTTGATSNDTTTTYSYPTPGSASDQPHTLTNTTATGPNAAQNTASYLYNADGATTSITSGANGSGDQTLTYNDQGQLASDVTSAGNTTYVYDASGNLLVRRDPGTTTLFLGDAQLTQNTATGALSGTRYYTIGGQTVAALTSTGARQILVPDRQGTDQLAIDTATDNTTRQQFLPFGQTRGTPPATWPGGDKGYIGGTPDPTTALENLGAREYDPTTGRFLTIDPEFEASDPTQMGGYDYAGNNPTTGSDPTGLHLCGDSCSGDGGGDGEDGELQNPDPIPTVFDSPGLPATPNESPIYIRVSPRVAVEGTNNAERLRKMYEQELHIIAPAVTNPDDAPSDIEGMVWADICSSDHNICDNILSETMDLVKLGDGIILINSCAVEGGCGSGSSGIVIDASGYVSIADHDIPAPSTISIQIPGAVDPAEGSCTGNSFIGNTPVLMSDGTTKPIDQVKVGDKITNAQPDSATTETDTVTAVHVTYTDRDYDQLTIATPDGPKTITSTAEHLFWDARTHSWVEADNLNIGDLVDTPDGGHIMVLASRHYKAVQTTYNLTVQNTHTYYVEAGNTPVLVHNAKSCTSGANAAALQGTAVHNAFSDFLDDIGGGYRGEETLPSGKRIDGSYTDPATGAQVPIELKPANDRQWQKATGQIAGYEDEMGAPPGSGQIWQYSYGPSGALMFTRVE